MKNYAEMSDEELNFEVARHSFDAGWLDRHYGKEGMVPDYCNDWEVAGPIMIDNGICLVSPIKPRDRWAAVLTNGGGIWSINDFTHHDKNPLRAAMIVFLMMKDAEK